MKKRLLISLLFMIVVGQLEAQSTNAKETINVATRAGSPLTLLGEPTMIGAIAPNFTAIDFDGKEVNLSDFKSKIVVIAVMPSIDTKVCAMETREFNKRATELSDQVVVLTLSKDLPFALGRFCAAEGINNVHALSDYKESEFGLKYGFLIKENKLLTRGVVIIDKQGNIAYVEYVKDISKEPNYDAAMNKIKTL